MALVENKKNVMWEVEDQVTKKKKKHFTVNWTEQTSIVLLPVGSYVFMFCSS